MPDSMEQLTAELAVAQKEIIRRGNNALDLQYQLDSATADLASSRAQVEALTVEHNALQAEKDMAQKLDCDEHTELRMKLAYAEDEATQLRRELEAVRAAIRNIVSVRDGFHSERELNEAINAALQARKEKTE